MTGADVRIGDEFTNDEGEQLTVASIQPTDFGCAGIAWRCVSDSGAEFVFLGFEDMPLYPSGIIKVARNGKTLWQH